MRGPEYTPGARGDGPKGDDDEARTPSSAGSPRPNPWAGFLRRPQPDEPGAVATTPVRPDPSAGSDAVTEVLPAIPREAPASVAPEASVEPEAPAEPGPGDSASEPSSDAPAATAAWGAWAAATRQAGHPVGPPGSGPPAATPSPSWPSSSAPVPGGNIDASPGGSIPQWQPQGAPHAGEPYAGVPHAGVPQPPSGATPPIPGPPAPGGPPAWQPASAPLTPPGSSDRTSYAGLKRLAGRHFVIPVVGVAIVITATLFGSVVGGGSILSSSDEELCSAYRAAENSWDYDLPSSASDFDDFLSGGYDDFTDTEDIEKLGSVARKHGDPDVREAGEKIDDLSGVFSYDRYSSIVSPIEDLC